MIVYGGTFDPPHKGHSMLARYLSGRPEVERILMLVTPGNPLKQGRPLTPLTHRVEMCRLAMQGCAKVEVSDFEQTLPSPHYTIDTLRALVPLYPGKSMRLLVGTDNLLLLDHWKEPEALLSEFGIYAYPRPGFDISTGLPPGVALLKDAPQSEVSSTQIREALRGGKSASELIHPEVVDYIETHHLYGR